MTVPEEQSLRRALSAAEREKHFFDALCIDYTAAYCCDLISDKMELIKRKDFSHCASSEERRKDVHSYSEWIRYGYDNIIIRETAPDYLEVFDNKNLMERMKKVESFGYRHQTRPNQAGMQYFEIRVVRLYQSETSFQIILGYRPIDDIVAEERKNRERLEAALKAAQEASRAKSAFLFNMSHDIRTPMNAIIGYTHLLKSSSGDPEKRADYLEKLSSSSQYLLSLLNDVLEMARIESGKVTLDEAPCSADTVMNEIYGVFDQLMAEKGITFTHTIHVEHSNIWCDIVKLKEIMLNILSNAYKYTLPGGRVDYTLEELPSERPGWVQYCATVRDTGVGMSEEFLATIFDSFTRERSSTESGQEGTGLGMAITKKLIELMDGRIDIQSAPGRGTTVRVYFPRRIAEETARLEPSGGRKAPVSFVGRRLLLAEDNDLNAEIAEELLKADGFLIERARDGVECIGMLEGHPGGYYDAILMDIQMPNMDGYKATSVIRRLEDPRLATVPILAMTANAFDEDRRKALSVGMNAHIAKPIRADVVEKALLEIL